MTIQNIGTGIWNIGYLSVTRLCQEGAVFLRRANIESARLDAELLLAEAVGQKREYLLSHGEEVVTPAAARRFESMIKRRMKREPVAYILGRKEFYGMEFFVNQHVLIPRPKTEEMVDRACAILEQWRGNNDKGQMVNDKTSSRFKVQSSKSQKTHTKYAIRNTPYDCLVIDAGTGSGILAVTMKQLFPSVSVLAIDVSRRALEVAGKNAQEHGFEVITLSCYQGIKDGAGIHFLQSDLLSRVGEVRFPNILILANLPYVPTREIATLEKDVREHEPQKALDGGEDGLDLFRRLAKQIRQTFPDKNVRVIWECEEGQEEEMGRIFGSLHLPFSNQV